MGVITLARVYDDEGVASGPRFLVERLWPRGVRRADLRLSDWLPDVGPSTELRRWFGHEPLKWEDFRRRYFDELERHPEAWRPLRDAAAAGDITLLYSSRDVEHNNAVALREYLMARLESTSSDDLARAATAEGKSSDTIGAPPTSRSNARTSAERRHDDESGLETVAYGRAREDAGRGHT